MLPPAELVDERPLHQRRRRPPLPGSSSCRWWWRRLTWCACRRRAPGCGARCSNDENGDDNVRASWRTWSCRCRWCCSSGRAARGVAAAGDAAATRGAAGPGCCLLAPLMLVQTSFIRPVTTRRRRGRGRRRARPACPPSAAAAAPTLTSLLLAAAAAATGSSTPTESIAETSPARSSCWLSRSSSTCSSEPGGMPLPHCEVEKVCRPGPMWAIRSSGCRWCACAGAWRCMRRVCLHAYVSPCNPFPCAADSSLSSVLPGDGMHHARARAVMLSSLARPQSGSSISRSWISPSVTADRASDSSTQALMHHVREGMHAPPQARTFHRQRHQHLRRCARLGQQLLSLLHQRHLRQHRLRARPAGQHACCRARQPCSGSMACAPWRWRAAAPAWSASSAARAPPGSRRPPQHGTRWHCSRPPAA